jgi:hypothetical protein
MLEISKDQQDRLVLETLDQQDLLAPRVTLVNLLLQQLHPPQHPTKVMLGLTATTEKFTFTTMDSGLKQAQLQ